MVTFDNAAIESAAARPINLEKSTTKAYALPTENRQLITDDRKSVTRPP